MQGGKNGSICACTGLAAGVHGHLFYAANAPGMSLLVNDGISSIPYPWHHTLPAADVMFALL